MQKCKRSGRTIAPTGSHTTGRTLGPNRRCGAWLSDFSIVCFDRILWGKYLKFTMCSFWNAPVALVFCVSVEPEAQANWTSLACLARRAHWGTGKPVCCVGNRPWKIDMFDIARPRSASVPMVNIWIHLEFPNPGVGIRTEFEASRFAPPPVRVSDGTQWLAEEDNKCFVAWFFQGGCKQH